VWEEFADTGPFTKPPVVSFFRTMDWAAERYSRLPNCVQTILQ
jgi:hypothetical protein